jgi:hypothetical protein
VLYDGQVEGKEAFTYKVKVTPRRGETSQSVLSDKDNISETEREETVAKLPRTIALGETARSTIRTDRRPPCTKNDVLMHGKLPHHFNEVFY